jgi:serine/threonine protein phosphatase PrpC
MDGDDIIANGRLFSSECTRTIGDFGLKKACFGVIVSDPEFTVVHLKDADHHLVVACDGIWKTVTPQRAAEIALQALQTVGVGLLQSFYSFLSAIHLLSGFIR